VNIFSVTFNCKEKFVLIQLTLMLFFLNSLKELKLKEEDFKIGFSVIMGTSFYEVHQLLYLLSYAQNLSLSFLDDLQAFSIYLKLDKESSLVQFLVPAHAFSTQNIVSPYVLCKMFAYNHPFVQEK
jgi:hypothetical protein